MKISIRQARTRDGEQAYRTSVHLARAFFGAKPRSPKADRDANPDSFEYVLSRFHMENRFRVDPDQAGPNA